MIQCKFNLCTFILDKTENKIYHIVGTIAKSNIKIVERGKIDTPNTQTHGLFNWK
jgi:hypothetical protein